MRTSRKPRIILIFLIALCGIFVYSYTTRLGEMSQVQADIVVLQARIDDAKQEQYELLQERDELGQPDFLDRVAREDFGLAKPGDKLLVIVDDTNSGVRSSDTLIATTAPNSMDFRNSPVWQQWIHFFTTDSFKLSLQ